MKTVESRNAASTIMRETTPFFSKESDQHFFGSTRSEKPFFPSGKNSASSLQTKLNIGQPDDQFEKEADSVADLVVSQKCAGCDDGRKVQESQEKEYLSAGVKKLHRKPIFESNAESPEDETPVQKKADHSPLQMVNPSTESSLNSSKDSGHPLPENTRQQMESSIGADFSDVRIHSDYNAARMSKDLNAQAFTQGNDVYFNSGKYNTSNQEGQHLLAHELTHTIQQSTSCQTKLIQRNGTSTTAAQPTPAALTGPPYKINNDKVQLDTSANPKTLKLDKISLPNFKKRNEAKFIWPLHSLQGRPQGLDQGDIWEKAVKSAANARVVQMLEKLQHNQDNIYFLKSKESDFRLFGTQKQIQDNTYIPDWNRFGKPNKHEVDHIVEFQLGGANEIDNLELTDSVANTSSGRNIKGERESRISTSLSEFTKAGLSTSPKLSDILNGYIISFSRIDNWNLPYTGDGKVYWNRKEIEEGKHLFQLRSMTPAEIANSQGTSQELVLYVNKNSGSPLRIKLPFAGPDKNWLPGIDLVSLTLNPSPSDNNLFGSIGIMLTSTFSKNLQAASPFTVSFNKTPGLFNTGYLTFTKDQKAIGGLLRFVGLSPVTIDDFRLDEKKGLMLSGTIQTDLPLFQGAKIDLAISGKEIKVSKTFSLEDIKNIPRPFRVTTASVAIFASTESGFGVNGNIDFEIEKFGKGSLTGLGATGKGFGVRGDFFFDKKLFDGSVKVGYSRGLSEEKGNWTFEGTVSVGKHKITGVDKLSLTMKSENDVLSGKGEASLSIPGIKEVVINAVLLKNGDFSIEGIVDFNKIPKLEGANGKIILTKTGDVWDISFSGEIHPKIKVDGLTVDGIKLDYHKGIFDISGSAHFKKGKVHGNFDMGVTNKPVKDGRKEETDTPRSDLSFYASGTLSIIIVEGVEGTIKVTVKPEGDFLIAGKIELTADKYIVNPKEENGKTNKSLMIFDFDKSIPIASCGVASVLLGLVGGVGLFYAFDGLKIDKGSNVELKEVSLSNLSLITLSSEISMSTGLSAGVEAYIGATASLQVLIAGIRGIGKINLKFTAVEIKTTAKVGADFSIDKGIRLKTAKLALDIFSKLSYGLELGVEVYLDLLLGTITLWDHSWKPEGLQGEKAFPLFDGELDFSLNFGDNNTMSIDDIVKGIRAPLETKAKNPDTYLKGSSRAVNDDGPSEAEKTEESKQTIRKDLKDAYRGAHSAAVFAFNQTLDVAYFEKRVDVWNRIHTLPNLDFRLVQVFEEEIRRYEFEEYEAFGEFLGNDTSFDANAQRMLIEDFLKYRLTLGMTEKVNLESLVKKEKTNRPGKSDKKGTKPVQRHPDFKSEKDEPVSGKRDRKTSAGNNGDNFWESMNEAKGGGYLLPESVREKMETAIGADFSYVKIHNDADSHQLSEQINAQAFTQGNDIFFNEGKYDTVSSPGQQLLAHELVHVLQQKGGGGTENVYPHPVAPTPVVRKTQADIFGVGVLAGMYLTDFKSYTNVQADWFAEPTLTAADRNDLWKLLLKTRPGSPVLDGVGDLTVSELRGVTEIQWTDLLAYCRGCDSSSHTVRIIPSGLLADRIMLGSTLRNIEISIPAIVLEQTVTESQLKRVQTDGLLVPLMSYFTLFQPHLQETVGSAAGLKGGVKSETQLLLDFIKAPGMLSFISLLGRVRNLHRFAPDALTQLMFNFSDFSHTKPVYLILYSGHDYNSAFIRSKLIFENLIKDRSKLVLMLEGQGSLQDIIDKVPLIARDYGQPDAGKINRIAQVMIAGHGSSRSVEMAGTGAPSINAQGEVIYNTESLDLDKNNAQSIKLLEVLLDNMNPATARIVYAGCLVGSTEVPVKDPKGVALNAADIKREVNDPARKSLASTTRDLAAARGKGGMVVEGAMASVALGDSKSLQDSAGNLHVDYTFDPTSYGNANAYVATGREPEGVMRAAVELAAVNPVVAANQLRIRLVIPAGDNWYDPLTLIFVKAALDGVPPGGAADIIKLNQLASMAPHFLLAYWASRSIAFFGADVNTNPPLANTLYTEVLALPAMSAPGDIKTKQGRFILELAWCMLNAGRSANVIAYLDGRADLTAKILEQHLDIAWLNAAGTGANLFPPASAATDGRLRLTIAWINKDNKNADVRAFLDSQVNIAGPRPRLQPAAIAQLSNPADEDGILLILGRIVPMVGPGLPAANADAFRNVRGPAMNDVRIEENIYIANVIPPAYVLNVRTLPSMAGIPFHWLKRGESVNVMGFVHNWAAVDINGRLGFAYKNFLSPPPA